MAAPPSARETVGLIEHHAGRATSICADVADDAEVRRMIATTRERFGRLDILVNNAGIVEAGAGGRVAFPEIEPERWMRMLDVNLRGVLLGTQHAIDAMRESGGGVIINVSSMAGMGLGPHPAPVYAAGKAAVVRFSAALAPEEWQAIAPPVMTQPEEIAAAVVQIIADESLAGRVMLCVGPKPWPLAEPPGRAR